MFKKARYAIERARTVISTSLVLTEGKEVLDLLQHALVLEYHQWDLYYSYKDLLTGEARDSIEAHLAEHAAEEAEHIEVLQRYIFGMGAKPTTSRKKIPTIDTVNNKNILTLELEAEREALVIYQEILNQLEDSNTGLRIDIENILQQETEHVLDLQLLIRV